ncbi:MarR family winged helix-turn-helix transcriptional regulator [Pectinatus sottacetonis]|uniref:MarR family winged helix-turn-helix transcriptional regulator n=1 Tax=Pectinatus sottacetonis TaxID=1002795 RepID=UPI0018C7B57F|nr:MarR family winged helix-turn-helix transcriptional regulator [Pectinatus sottacetonis]
MIQLYKEVRNIISKVEKYQRCIDDIGILLQKTVRTFQILEREQIKKHGLTNSQCYILLELRKFKILPIKELSQHLHLDISTITRVMNNLVRDKFIIKKRSSYDRRSIEASLTAKGLSTANILKKDIDDYYRKVIEQLPPGHVREVMSSFELLVEALADAMH